MRIDAPTMSPIEGEMRKAIGVGLAKDWAPVIGKTGVAFEREALLNLYSALNAQRHLTGGESGCRVRGESGPPYADSAP
jgi:hypothetical protein